MVNLFVLCFLTCTSFRQKVALCGLRPPLDSPSLSSGSLGFNSPLTSRKAIDGVVVFANM